MTIEVLQYPTEKDWQLCKECTLGTIHKSNGKIPDLKWKKKILASEHSPIRVLNFTFRIHDLPYWVAMHLVRHHVGMTPFVSTQRTDRTGIDRNELKQGELVMLIMNMNAQALINICHKRLCKQASKETREVIQAIVDEVLKTNPEFNEVLVPNCVYRGGKCTEFFSCGKGTIK